MKTLSIDIETYSEASLSSTGVYRYAADQSFTILLFAYSVDAGPGQIVDLAQGESLPAEVEAALSDLTVEKWAFNAQFGRVCLSAYLGERLDPRGWYCSLVWSTYAGIPLNLAGVAQALHLEAEKMTEGKDLIRKFSQPCKATKSNGGRTRNLPEHAMEDWETFKAYCVRDVEVERAIASRLSPLPMPAFEWENYWRDQRFNDLGVGIDVELASKAVEADLEIKEALYTQMKHWTGVENPQSVTQLLGWLQEHGAQLPSLAKADVASALEEADGSVADVLELIRAAFVAAPGHRFLVADFSAIEARVIAWLAGEQWVLDLFKNGGDIYCETGTRMFGQEVKKHSPLRQRAKVAVLACGYQGGVGALKAMGGEKLGLSEDEMASIVDAWRKANPRIAQMWWDVNRAALEAIKNGTSQMVGRIKVYQKLGALVIALPSGRELIYPSPRVGENRFGGESITFMGLGLNRKWGRIETYGGKLVENIVQATARDVLAHSMATLEAAGYPTVMHVHDEVITEVPYGCGSVEELCALMSRGPKWSKGLPLAAEGFESTYYRKG